MGILLKKVLRDRRGMSSTAIASIFSIIVLLGYLGFMNTEGGAEKLSALIFDFLKLIGVLGEDLDPSGILDSPVGPLAAYIASFVGMTFIVIITFGCTKYSLDITDRILAWRRTRREEKRQMPYDEAQGTTRCREGHKRRPENMAAEDKETSKA